MFNETDCDMAYFDGGEEVAVQLPHWHNQDGSRWASCSG